MKVLGIILPALDEEASLYNFVTSLLKVLGELNLCFKIVIINDGSTDRTSEISKKLTFENLNIRLIENKHPMNIGYCYKQGLEVLHDVDYITWFPTDGEISPSVLNTSWEKVTNNKIIIPYPENGKGNRNKFRRIISIIYIFILNKMFKLNLKYFNGNAIIPRSILNNHELISSGFTINTEIILHSIKAKNLSYEEVPFKLEKRMGGKAKAISIKNLINVFRGVKKLRETYNE